MKINDLNVALRLTDIDECKNNPCDENEIYKNRLGNFSCSCKHGYFGNGKKDDLGCIAESSQFPVIEFSLCISFSNYLAYLPFSCSSMNRQNWKPNLDTITIYLHWKNANLCLFGVII